jgi:hypothetical protein
MPYLEPPVAEAYPRLRDEYVQLPQDASPEELAQLEAALLGILAAVLKQKGLTLEYNLRAVP